ncbi:LGFP repeat-containing protein, partial [Geodermatophilus sp. SYSU D00710]
MRFRSRLLFAGLCVLGLGLVTAVVSLPRPSDLRESANLSLFDPGHIISDGVFYDSSTMSVEDIQTFLNSKGANCSGSTCLRSYRQDTAGHAADGYCNGYQGAGQETAAVIVHKVARSCGINPQVLLVTLQKEQGLITSSGPSTTVLRKAMGYGCPDTPEGCDAQYYGFQNQVYMAARQFKLYQARPTRYGYRAGLTNTIAYYPNNPGCGSAQVYIQNQATAGLYNYTPYVPNKASLDAGYGGGDGCSSYGNRNFYNYFTDWFGSTQSNGPTAVSEKYQALRAAGMDIGARVSDVRCDLPGGGCLGSYSDGATASGIYWSKYTGAHVVRGENLERYRDLGGPGGPLGYPTGDETAAPWNTGFWVDFQHGSIYWSGGTGAWEVRGELLARWRSLGAQAGSLGYPTGGNTATANEGFSSDFQYGSLYWSSATGVKVVRGEILKAYRAAGGPGVLGYPTADEGPT